MTKPLKPRKFIRVLWTPEEEAYLRQHYPDTKSQDIADHLGRSLGKVYAKADCMDLNKSPDFMASEASGRMKAPLHGGKAFWFKKGQAPANKGKPAKYNANSAATQFSKGNRPVNYREVGTLRINSQGYVDIKLADGKNQWFLLARYNWFLDTGYWTNSNEVFWYRDDDKENCEVGNLELITRREHLRRTSMHNLPKDIVKIIQLRGSLTRTINRTINRITQQQTTQQPQGATA